MWFSEYKYFAFKNDLQHKSNTVQKKKKNKRLPDQPERRTKSQAMSGHENVAVNQNMFDIGLLHICRL